MMMELKGRATVCYRSSRRKESPIQMEESPKRRKDRQDFT